MCDAPSSKMSSLSLLSTDDSISVCANCGKQGTDITNTCNKCNSVKYCNAACKKKHRHKHKKECERKVAELHDEKLFKQPPQLKEDCPICFLNMSCLISAQMYMSCCGKDICCGCIHASEARDKNKKSTLCPFCRTPAATTERELTERYEKRMSLNDGHAFYNFGCFYTEGMYGYPQNFAKALELYHRSAELGYFMSYFTIGNAYNFGRGVEVDAKKAINYYELAAMCGVVEARHNLGLLEKQAGNVDRALKHYTIAVECGFKISLECIREFYMEGHATKDDYTNALQSYQSYLDEIKSKQRDEAATFKADWKYY